METETPAEPIIVDEAENQSFLGFKFGALINSEKSVDFQQLRKTLRPWTARRDSGEHGLLVGIQGKWRPPQLTAPSAGFCVSG